MHEPLDKSAAFSKINDDLIAPLQQTGWGYWSLAAGLAGLVLAGLAAWIYQIQTGIGQTNLHKSVFWGVYIASFVFWIGVSHSGTFISGVLHLTKADWRIPVTRISELMTVFAVTVSALFVFYHLGRVWMIYYMIPYPNQREIWPNFRSPLMWDATAIFTYSVSSTLYLYVPLIPDFALLRDRMQGWRHRLYRCLSLGWSGSATEWKMLHAAIRIIAPLIVMVMISVHSIVGWDFGVALVPGWHSTIFAPYFVLGAVHSGLGMVVIGLYLIRRAYRLQAYISGEHFDKLGKLMLTTTLLWGYLYFAERLTVWYGGVPDEMVVLDAQLTGVFAVPHWIMVACNFVVPLGLLVWPPIRRAPLWMLLIGLIINVGMYLERILILVPSLSRPRLPYVWTSYLPSAIETTILIGTAALFTLMYLLAIKVVPVITIWEEKVGRRHAS